VKSSECILVLAPIGRDAEVAQSLLREAGYDAQCCSGIEALAAEIRAGAGMAVMADDALIDADLRALSAVLAEQESWSDFPVVVLTRHGGGPERNPAAARLGQLLGNVSFLERPFHPTTFISLVQTSIRARRRQYEARTRLASLSDSEARLSRLTASLEEKVEQELNDRRRAEDALRQAQKMEALGQLTGGVAHDFNNLLMAITGNMDLLRKHLDGDERARRLIDGALQGASRGAALTQRMLAFARQQDLQTGSTDISSLILGMEDLLDRSLGPQITLELHPGKDLPPVEVDPSQVELAILNLAINARDAMPNGGRITICAEFPPERPGTLGPGRYVRVQVRDTGTGMSEELLAKAVDPFFSTKPVGRGTGLGLSMVHGLAVQLGGLFELESEVGAGTTASIWLPASAKLPKPTPQAAPAEPAVPARKQSATILLVDDDLLIAMATAGMLEDLGHKVMEAHSGKAALELLKESASKGEKIDLMVTDHAMPGMTGVELAAAVHGLLPQLPILLATGYADLPGQKSDLPRLSKPYIQDTLRAAVDKLLAGAGAMKIRQPQEAGR
jgi:signal transduction histidine kinase/ActR/RegA family two-component response regulator